MTITGAAKYPHAAIMNNVLGQSGFGSRLMTSAREDKGLTYGIYSYFLDFAHADALIIGTSTQNERAGDMMTLIVDELAETKRFRLVCKIRCNCH